MIPDDLFPALVKGAREAVWDAFAAAHRVTQHRVPEEVEHVWALVETGSARLAAEWRPVLARRGISLRVTGVLIHQTPKAHYDHPFDGPVKPELGDLLVVHDHIGAVPSRRALLLQAKRIVDGVPTSPPDVHQEYLYRHWPDFTLHGRGGGRPAAPYLPGHRTIYPNPGGSIYGLVDDDANPHGRCAICYPQHAYLFPWMAADPAAPPLAVGAEDLGSLLANMLYSTAYPRGRAAQQIAGPLALSVTGAPNNHFDVTIEELLRLAAARTASFKRYPNIGGTRGQSVLCYRHPASGGPPLPPTGEAFVSSGDGEDRERPPESVEYDEDGGMSVLLIETGSESRE